MTSFLRKVFFYGLPLAVLVVVVNFHGDAANLFNVSLESEIAANIVAGKNVTGVSNLDDRLLQKEIVLKMEKAPDLIILGSSRSLQVRQDRFDNAVIFNHSVYGATLEDFLAITNLYSNKGQFPRRLVLNLDPWILNKFHNQTRWKSLKDEVDEFRLTNENVKAKESFSFDNRMLQIFSPSYFQASLKKIRNREDKYAITDIEYNKRMTRLFDGSVTYDESIRNAAASSIEQEVEKSIAGKIYSLEMFQQLDPRYKTEFERLVEYWRDKGTEITFMLLPYHPKVYKIISLSGNYKMVIEAEFYFRKLAMRNDIKVLGSYDPTFFGLNGSYFMDGIHLSEKGIEKVLDAKRTHNQAAKS